MSFWVFFNRLAGCGATWKVFVQVGGEHGEPGTREGTFGDVQPDGVSQFKESMHFNAFHAVLERL